MAGISSIAPFGSWASPITSAFLAEHALRLSDPFADGDLGFWLEGRPGEQGRQVLVARDRNARIFDVVGRPFSIRTLVHEYGGRCAIAACGEAYFSSYDDQCLYRVIEGQSPVAITASPEVLRSHRYAALVLTPDAKAIICVRERHLGCEARDVVNDIVMVPTDGSGALDPDALVVLASSHDFYGAPAISPDGSKVAFTCWDHPNMPWDATLLYEVALGADFGAMRLVAGGSDNEESITQPRYDPAQNLHFISDRSGWWNLYKELPVESMQVARGGERQSDARRTSSWPQKKIDDVASRAREVHALCSSPAEFAGPDWVLGRSSYTFIDDKLVGAWTSSGRWHLGVLGVNGTGFEEIETPYTFFDSLAKGPDGVLCVAASPYTAPSVVEIDIHSGHIDVVRKSKEGEAPIGYVSQARSVSFPTAGGEVAHALVYPPVNADYEGPKGELPPLIVSVHGGPTSASRHGLDYSVQYWTSRGFCVAALDYRGSSGYGRAYRKRLNGGWGVLDVEDAEHLATWLSSQDQIDAARACIRGGSAGGYTVLCAAMRGTTFAAGASYYGVADPASLARDTHKFESRYLDALIGPLPEAAPLYEERSPYLHGSEMRMALILFQGMQDEIVPPSQAEMMVAALKEHAVPVAYVAFEGEQHGFRQASSIIRSAEAELYFYARVLGFTPADEIGPVEIANEISHL